MRPFVSQKIKCLLIDLDETLYPPNIGLWTQYRRRIDHYLVEKIGIDPKKVDALRHRLYMQYGTTLRGLQHEYTVDMDDFLFFVHDVPLENYIQPDPGLLAMFSRLPQRKVIFTNAHADHAQRVIAALDVQNIFDQIIDIYDLVPHCKPQPEAFETALGLIPEAPETCLMVDDSPKNLATAQTFGITTVSVGLRKHTDSLYVSKIHQLSKFFEQEENPASGSD